MKRILTFVIVVTALLAGCAKNLHYRELAWGYRVVNASARLGEQFDKALAGVLAMKLKLCQAEQPTPPTVESKKALGKCLAKELAVSRAWTGEKDGKKGPGALPMLQAAQKAARLALDIAFDYLRAVKGKCADAACGHKTKAWQRALKKALCGALAVMDDGLKLGAEKVRGSATYKLITGAVKALLCGGG